VSLSNAIHLVGASGSGTTSVGRRLADILCLPHYDTDTFYWEKSEVPFSQPREESDRIKMLSLALQSSDSWVLSGSLCGWGDVFVPRFTLVVWLRVNHDIRMKRLLARETARYGDAILNGGEYEEMHKAFMYWAGGYDFSEDISRNASRHNNWLKDIECPVKVVFNEGTLDETVNLIIDELKTG
jgi:hypothetical protein